MKDAHIHHIVRILSEHLRENDLPIVTQLAENRYDPFVILVSTLLSLRTKDEVTAVATERLLALADTPAAMLAVPEAEIARVIFPVGFYRNKARTLHGVCRDLLEHFGGQVPDDLDTLLTLKGVGRKTANLVVSLGFDKPGICVDTHVHRISNRFGYVRTKTPEETELALRAKLPPEHWKIYNTLMVAFGREICHPTSPRCSICRVAAYCDRIGVTRSR